MIEKIWNLLTTLTQEAQQAALSKCRGELGYDPNRGRVRLDESYINLQALFSAACTNMTMCLNDVGDAKVVMVRVKPEHRPK